ncbi:MAG: HAD family hydrolase [Candidatus Helarchaeota archaeon]
MIKTIIFDLDGTLINLNLDFKKLKKEIQELLQIPNDLVPFLESIFHHTEDNLGLRKEALDLIENYEEACIPNLEIYPETVSVIRQLKEKGYNLALVTMQGQKAANLILLKLSLNQLFYPIITRERSIIRSEQINLIIKALKLSKTQVIMVGDRLNDVNAARMIGITPILIRRCFNPLEGTIVIQSLAEILDHI